MTNRGSLNTLVEYSTQTHTQIILTRDTETSRSPLGLPTNYQTFCSFGTEVTFFFLYINTFMKYHTSAFSGAYFPLIIIRETVQFH